MSASLFVMFGIAIGSSASALLARAGSWQAQARDHTPRQMPIAAVTSREVRGGEEICCAPYRRMGFMAVVDTPAKRRDLSFR